MKTSLILPVFIINNELAQMTDRCFMSMAQQKPDEVIAVDDGSHVAYGENKFSNMVDAKFVHLPKNYGYTVAVNVGLKAALGDVIVVANNDLLFAENWLTALIKPLKEGFDISSLPTIEPNSGVTLEKKITTGDKFGSIWAVKKKVIDKIGYLDEKLGRGYFTDLDFQKRAEDAGFKVGKNHGLALIHEPKSTFKQIDPEDKLYLESMTRFKQKYGKIW